MGSMPHLWDREAPWSSSTLDQGAGTADPSPKDSQDPARLLRPRPGGTVLGASRRALRPPLETSTGDVTRAPPLLQRPHHQYATAVAGGSRSRTPANTARVRSCCQESTSSSPIVKHSRHITPTHHLRISAPASAGRAAAFAAASTASQRPWRGSGSRVAAGHRAAARSALDAETRAATRAGADGREAAQKSVPTESAPLHPLLAPVTFQCPNHPGGSRHRGTSQQDQAAPFFTWG